MQINKQKFILSGLVVAFLIAIDQVVKYKIRVNGGFYICNANLAFGLNINFTLFLLFAFILLILNLNFKNLNIKELFKNSKFPPKADQPWAEKIKNLNLFFIFTMILIFAGSFSNIIDRIVSGCVIDFIDLKFWPVFNIADIYISAGAIIIIIEHITHSMKQKTK